MAGKKKGITCKRLLMFFCCCMMFLSGPFMESQAAQHKEANGVIYTFDISTNGGSRAVITEVFVPKKVTSVVVPDKVKDAKTKAEYPVVAIGIKGNVGSAGAFNNNKHLRSVILPDSVCEIYERAFDGLNELKTISLNGDGIVIGNHAFKGCDKLSVTFRGTGAVKYISGYAFEMKSSNCLDYNVIKSRVDKDSWVGYDATWNNEADWSALVNSLTPFSISVKNNPNQNWKPVFDELDPDNGYPNKEQIVSASTVTSDYNAWIRKSAKWVDSDKRQAEIRLDVAYNPISATKSANDMVFVLDVSGSMYFANNLISGSNYSRQFQTLDQARSVGKALLDLNDAGTTYNRVGAAMFNHKLRGSSRSAAGATDGFFTDYASFIKWLDKENYVYNGATGYSSGLDEAAYLFRHRADKSRTPSVIFLSDGAPNYGVEGTFPGSSIEAHGGASTTELSKLGVTRYGIILGDINAKVEKKNYTVLEAITYIAGAPGTSNDRTKTYASPDAATLQQAFQEIIGQIAENLSLSLSDMAGNAFAVNAPPTATGGSVSISGANTIWDLSGTSPCQVYTLTIIQDLKRNSEDNNAFFYGNLETNYGKTFLEDVAIGGILDVDSPILQKAHETVTIHVEVINGLAIGTDGKKNDEIWATITKGGSYEANYEGSLNATLKSIAVSADGGIPVLVSTTGHDTSYEIKDAQCNYDIVVVFQPPKSADGTWTYSVSIKNGTITGSDGEENIPIEDNEKTINYSPDDNCELEYISVTKNMVKSRLSEDELQRNSTRYELSGAESGDVYHIQIQYKEITKTDETDRIWGDYRN